MVTCNASGTVAEDFEPRIHARSTHVSVVDLEPRIHARSSHVSVVLTSNSGFSQSDGTTYLHGVYARCII